MIVAAIYDACRRALEGEATSLQLVTGEIVPGPSGNLSFRGTRSPAAFNLCARCVGPVQQALQVLLQQGRADHAESA